jgi:hypothetical protein
MKIRKHRKRDIKEITNLFEQELVDRGYHFFQDHLNNSIRGIQKRIVDKEGTKYFITGYHYNFNDGFGDKYSFKSQFRFDQEGKDQLVTLNFSGDFTPNEYRPITTIDEMEEFYEKFFQLFKPDYYEKD